MIYLDISMDQFLKKYPKLAGTMTHTCGTEMQLARGWVDKKLIGVESEKCTGCDNPHPAVKFIYRNWADNERMLNLIWRF